MEKAKMDRISELTAISRQRELSEEEKAERQALREEYLADWRRGALEVLENTYVVGPDGKTLSPAAVSYIREAAMLTSRGFSALLLNLAAQKIVDMKGTGSSKDPYVLQTDGEILKRIPYEEKEEQTTAPKGEISSQQKRSIWKELLQKRRGFDLAEWLCVRSLFPTRPPEPLEMGRKNTWKMAVARSVSYAALSSKYRDMWVMNTALVSLMFTLCYGGTILVQGTLWLNYGAANIAAVLTAIALSIAFTFVVHNSFKYMVNIYVRWQEMGWGSFIYFAALSSVDKSLIEAADIDGANRLQKIWYINLPVLVPTIMVLLVLQFGSLLSVGYEKVYLLQNSTNLSASEVISTYVYKVGLQQADFSFSAAVDVFNSVINTTILLLANGISRKLTHTSLF